MDMVDLLRSGFQSVQQQVVEEPAEPTGQVYNDRSEDFQQQMSSPVVLMVFVIVETSQFIPPMTPINSQPAVFPNMGTSVSQNLPRPNGNFYETCHPLCPCRTHSQEGPGSTPRSSNGNGLIPITTMVSSQSVFINGQVTAAEGNYPQNMIPFVAQPFFPHMVNNQQYYHYRYQLPTHYLGWSWSTV